MTRPVEQNWTKACEQAHADLTEFLAGKDVVIVGPAGSLQGRNRGPEIDDFDVVVRTNLSAPVSPELVDDVGSRTDLLYHVLFSGRLSRASGQGHNRQLIDGWRSAAIRFVVTRQAINHGRVTALRRVLRGVIPLVIIPEPLKAQVKQATNTNPNTGVMAIAHLLSLPIRSLHVTGFDFYETGWQVGYGGFNYDRATNSNGGRGAWGTAAGVPHEQDGQKAFLADLASNDPRLTFDTIAGEALGIIERPPPVTAIVPMKGSSERLPGKNVRDLCGKPLLFWTLDALHKSRRVTRVVVDTDDDEIEALVREHHPDTIILRRPEHLLGGHITGNPLTEWALTRVDGEHWLQTHVTNPLLTPHTIDAAIDHYFAGLDEHDSLFAVTKHQFRLFDAAGEPVNHDPSSLARSQDLEPLYEDNSNLYLFSRESFARSGRIGKSPQMFEMNRSEAVDIDWPDDFKIAEALMARRLS